MANRWPEDPSNLLVKVFKDYQFELNTHYEFEEGTSSKSEKAKSGTKVMTTYCTFRDLSPHSDIIDQPYFREYGTDKNDAKNRVAEKVLRHVKQKNGWKLDIPHQPFSTERDDPIGELEKLSKNKKWEIVPYSDRYQGKLTKCTITIENINIDKFKGKRFEGISSNVKQAKRNAFDTFLTKYYEYRRHAERDRHERNAKRSEVDAVVGEASTFFGVLNERNKFITIKPNDFSQTENVAGEHNTNQSFMACLTFISNRENFAFTIEFLQRFIPEPGEIADESDQSEMAEVSETDQETKTYTEDQSSPPNDGSMHCVLTTKTRPEIAVFGHGVSREAAQNSAAQMALYSLQIQCGNNIWEKS